VSSNGLLTPNTGDVGLTDVVVVGGDGSGDVVVVGGSKSFGIGSGVSGGGGGLSGGSSYLRRASTRSLSRSSLEAADRGNSRTNELARQDKNERKDSLTKKVTLRNGDF
jgi:hypothetical protein